jgi:hypothetical protein
VHRFSAASAAGCICASCGHATWHGLLAYGPRQVPWPQRRRTAACLQPSAGLHALHVLHGEIHWRQHGRRDGDPPATTEIRAQSHGRQRP